MTNHISPEWLDAVYVVVGNHAPRILLARDPATVSAFAARPTRLMSFQGLATPVPVRI